MARPQGPHPATLTAHNVTAAPGWHPHESVLICGQCGASWCVTPAAGRLPAGYWHCPNGCNVADQVPTQPALTAAPAIPTELATLPAILTPAEAAGLLRVSETTVKAWARAGDLPGAFKLGKAWRVERAALLAYIRGQ